MLPFLYYAYTGGRHWEGILLALSDENGWSLGDYGNNLYLEGTNKHLVNESHSCKMRETIEDDHTEDSETIHIEHDGNFDLTDRVVLLKPILKKYKLAK